MSAFMDDRASSGTSVAYESERHARRGQRKGSRPVPDRWSRRDPVSESVLLGAWKRVVRGRSADRNRSSTLRRSTATIRASKLARKSRSARRNARAAARTRH